MKKVICFFIAGCVILTATACNKNEVKDGTTIDYVEVGIDGDSDNNIVTEYNNENDTSDFDGDVEYGAFDYENRGDLKYEAEHTNTDGSIDGVIKDTSMSDYDNKNYDINNDIVETYSKISGVWYDTDNDNYAFYANDGFKYTIQKVKCESYEIAIETNKFTVYKEDGTVKEFEVKTLLRMSDKLLAYECVLPNVDDSEMQNWIVIDDTDNNNCYVINHQGAHYEVDGNTLNFYIGGWNSSYANIVFNDDTMTLTEYTTGDEKILLDESNFTRFTDLDSILNIYD